MTPDEFETKMGTFVQGSARYSTLFLTKSVNITWKGDSFKVTGTYGK